MTIIASIDSTTTPRRIYLHSDTVGVTFQPMAAYKEMRTLRAEDETLRAYDVYMTSQGNEPTGPSTATPRRVRMENSVFVPFDTDHVLTVAGEVITSAGGSGTDAFDRTPLSSGTEVDINYIPPQVEIIYINTGGGGGGALLTTAQNSKLMSLGTPREIATTLMETPIPATPVVNTFGDLLKNKMLTVFKLKKYV
jgi:hypothetical protein